MSRAVAANLWECIDPNVDEEFLEKPEKPGFSQFRKRVVPAQTRSSQASSTSATPAPELLTNEQARSAEDLTTEARQQYGLLWSIFQHDTKQYDIQRAAIKELKSWILKTVSDNYIRTSCPPADDLRVWYKNLKENVGVTDERLKADVRDKYRKAIIPLKTTKGLDKWITQWEKAMSEAKAKNIGETFETSFWFDDFAIAVQDVAPTWITAYRMTKIEDIRNGSLTFRTVGNDFRDQLRVMEKSTNKPVKIAKGSFGPAFAGAEEPSADESQVQYERERKIPAKKPHKKGSNLKRKRDSELSQDLRDIRPRQICKACGMAHQLTKCYYVFPKMAPPTFKENPVTKRMVDLMLTKDTSLAEEVRRLSKEKDSGHDD
ncbi:hypothetical protein V8E54_001644 [Elaphomyces granulatus]